MRAVTIPRRHLEVYLETYDFDRAARGALVRVSQLINGKRNFYIAVVTGVKKTQRPYKVRDVQGV